MANEELEMFDVETVSIPLEDGTDLECAILDEFEVEGINYMVLAPIEEDDMIGEETYLYRFHEEGEDVILDYIDDEEELNRISDIYDQMCAEEDEE